MWEANIISLIGHYNSINILVLSPKEIGQNSKEDMMRDMICSKIPRTLS